jgi:hypothetical protein
MELLRILTLVYAAVLVLALAASLTAIWIFLRRIGDVLGDTCAALVRVEERTRPLQDLIQPLNSTLQASSWDLRETAARLQHADEALHSLAVRLGAVTHSGSGEG